MARSFSQFLLAVAVAAVVGGSALAQDTPLKEAVTLLRLNKPDDALAKLREILVSDPSNTQALELYRSVSQDEWFMLMTQKGEVQQIAQTLLERARVDMKARSRDEAAITALVATATSKDSDYGARRKAINALINEHGEFAVPPLVDKLGNPDDSEGQVMAISVLVELRTIAVVPLLEALKSGNERMVQNVAAALYHIDDDRALPLMSHLATDERLPVREVAKKYIAKKGVQAGQAVPMLLAQSQTYLKGIVPPGAYSDVVWSWNGEKLVANDVPALLYPCELAKSVAGDAVRIAPGDAAARSALAQANLAQANLIETSIQKGEESLKPVEAMGAELRITALATGLESLRSALRTGLEQQMAPVAVGAIQALQIAETRESMNDSPLKDALASQDKRVRYAAAEALVAASGGAAVPDSDRVVAVLGEAVTEQAVRVVQVIGPESTTKAAVEATNKVRGYAVEASADARSGMLKLRINPNVDVIVVNEALPDDLPQNIIGNVKKDPRLASAKILVLTTDEEKAKERFGDQVGYIKGPLTGEALVAEVNKAMEGVVDAAALRAESFAANASVALASVAANSNGAIAPVVANVAAQLGRADAVSVPAAKALGHGGGAGELPALSTALGGAGSVELKKAVAEAIGNICRRLGNCPDDVATALAAALDGATDVGLRTTIGVALSKCALSPAKYSELLKKLNRIAAPAAAAAPASEG